MKPAVPWLPADTLRVPRAARALVETIAAWTESWIAAGDWQVADRFQPACACDWPLLRPEARFALHAGPKAMLELAFALLGQKPRQGLTDADLRLLRRLAGQAIDDLVDRLGAVLPSPPPGPQSPRPARWRLTLGRDAQPLFSIVVDEPMLTVMARRGHDPLRRPSPLVAAREALRDVEVPLSSRIGSARLAVEQIDTIEVGDLLLLDESAGTPARLIVAGQPADLRFAIGKTDERLTLTMQE